MCVRTYASECVQNACLNVCMYACTMVTTPWRKKHTNVEAVKTRVKKKAMSTAVHESVPPESSSTSSFLFSTEGLNSWCFLTVLTRRCICSTTNTSSKIDRVMIKHFMLKTDFADRLVF